MVFAAVAALGGLALDYFGQQSAQKAQRRSEAERRQLFQQQLLERTNSFYDARTRYLGALSSIKAGFGAAAHGIDVQRAAGRRVVQRAAPGRAADTAQSLISRGLYSTGAYEAAGANVTIGISAALDQIDAQAAQFQAQLAAQRGLAEAGAQQDLGRLAVQDFAAGSGVYQSRINELMNTQYSAGTDWAQGLGQLASALDEGRAFGNTADGGSASAFHTGTYGGQAVDVGGSTYEFNPGKYLDTLLSLF